MYAYEIIIENDKVKSNDLKQVLKILKFMIEKGYELVFKDNTNNSYIEIYDIFDIAMIEDNMEEDYGITNSRRL